MLCPILIFPSVSVVRGCNPAGTMTQTEAEVFTLTGGFHIHLLYS